MIGVTAAASAGASFMRGDIVTAVAGPVALGSVVGAGLGARILIRASNAGIRLLFVVVLVALAPEMLLQVCGIRFLKGSLWIAPRRDVLRWDGCLQGPPPT